MQTHRQAINDIAKGQYGLITRSQISTCEASRSVRRRMLERGELEQVGRITYRIGGTPNCELQRVMLACLDNHATASHRTAAALHRMGRFSIGSKPEVVADRRWRSESSSIATVHSSTWLPSDDLVRVNGVPCLGVARTLISLAGEVPRVPADVVAAAVDEAVRDDKATDRWLCWRLEQVRCRGRAGILVLEEILSHRLGGEVAESWLEREFLRVLAAAGLELPVCQQRIDRRGAFVARVDFLYRATWVVIEVLGHEHHSTARQLAADARRRNELQLAGYRVLEFTYRDIVEHPEQVVASVRNALAAPVTGTVPPELVGPASQGGSPR